MDFVRYLDQTRSWPTYGRHILAQFDSDSIYVYQAYRPSIARFAVANQHFGDEFSFNRMSWIKPNFLWMMYRSGWATKLDQERILALRFPKACFEEFLRTAIVSTFDHRLFSSMEDWKAAVATSDVRLQWDPDHDPVGQPLDRRAVQLGLRGNMLRKFNEHLLSVEDITPFVIEQRDHATGTFENLFTPKEVVFIPSDEAATKASGIDRDIF